MPIERQYAMIYGNQLFSQAAQIPQKAFPELR
jgi:hypothetical protein